MRPVGEGLEPVAHIEAGGRIVDGVDDHCPRRDFLLRDTPKGVSEEEGPEPVAAVLRVDRQATEEVDGHVGVTWQPLLGVDRKPCQPDGADREGVEAGDDTGRLVIDEAEGRRDPTPRVLRRLSREVPIE